MQLVRPRVPLDNAYVVEKTLIKLSRAFIFPRSLPWDNNKRKLFGSHPVNKNE